MLSAIRARPALLLRLRQFSTAGHPVTPVTSPTNTYNVFEELKSRGFVADVTSPELRTRLSSPMTVYAGVDPSASSLHVGNLLPLLGLLHFRARGHKALALIGGATGSIGDPSGRSTERNALSPEELANNVEGITKQVVRFFERGGEYAKRHGYEIEAKDGSVGYEVVNNYDWFKDISFLDFLRDVGKLARVNTMLARESVRSRLSSDSGISFTEFSYQLLQAHDFATLYEKYNCSIQLGGSDQWGNIVAGIDLIKRKRSKAVADAEAEAEAAAKAAQANSKKPIKPAVKAEPRRIDTREPAFGITIPLLTTSSGEKFGKSAGNAIWLDEKRTSIFDFYQFFYRAEDADVEKYLRLLTLLPRETIDTVLEQHREHPKRREAQKLLAAEVTELVHGPAAVSRVKMISELIFIDDIRSLKSGKVLEALDGDPRFIRINRSELKGVPFSKLAFMYGLCRTRAEATRLIKPRGSGITVNGRPVTDPRDEMRVQNLIDKHLAVMKRGNKDFLVFYVDVP